LKTFRSSSDRRDALGTPWVASVSASSRMTRSGAGGRPRPLDRLRRRRPDNHLSQASPAGDADAAGRRGRVAAGHGGPVPGPARRLFPGSGAGGDRGRVAVGGRAGGAAVQRLGEDHRKLPRPGRPVRAQLAIGCARGRDHGGCMRSVAGWRCTAAAPRPSIAPAHWALTQPSARSYEAAAGTSRCARRHSARRLIVSTYSAGKASGSVTTDAAHASSTC